jgi:transcriptional regulator with XRE-family HTH domain
MAIAKSADRLNKFRKSVARGVRDLRLGRHWTQTELAARLGLSQGRLSEIERGEGSFSAEQLLLMLGLFNVSASHFAPGPQDRGAELQSALVRLGALHLHQSDLVLPSEQLDDVGDVVRQAVLSAVPRHLTALAPVIVHNCENVNLRRLHAELVQAGLERRLAWVVENTLEALRRERRAVSPRRLAQHYRRAEIVLETFLESVAASTHDLQRAQGALPIDLLDATIASTQTRRAMAEASSGISKRWGILTDLQPEDFLDALRAAHAGR